MQKKWHVETRQDYFHNCPRNVFLVFLHLCLDFPGVVCHGPCLLEPKLAALTYITQRLNLTSAA